MRFKIAALVFILVQSTFALDFGFVFSVNRDPTVGVDLKFNKVYDLRPHMAMAFADNFRSVVIGAENNFSPSNIGPVEQYIGIDPTLTFGNPENSGFFSFRTYYGLQYAFNNVISVFGEAGLMLNVDPNVFTTLNTGVGVIFYLVKGR